ncbi:GDSL esterase/lipase At2g03980-like [Gastrolobium bilobum]|uniref:GDSL esterase/lipase At2g03980-like n=1 Tax=Gastrolobium bilobum TaxID=150636 RepID=UPI002AB08DA7|nr:GDSL esterase/lipase At2g03980-like [Gastrolobium bilobum]
MNTKYLTLGFVLTLFLPLASAMNSYHPKQIPAMYVFGDSLVDSGNNNYLPIGGPTFLPYGIDFGGKPTGRNTNGKTVVDYIAIHLGLPFAPPYMGLSKHQREKITTGINYASAGSGMFHNGTFHGTTKFASNLLKEFSLRLQKMYDLGARKFLVNNIPPAGCFPSRAVHTRPRGKCVDKINIGITFYNRRLPSLLHELQSQLPGSVFVHSDLYKFLIELRENGGRYGIRETWKPCCPNNIYGDLKCRPNTVPCANRNAYLFFDDHPTQIANHIYATRCFNESTICRPSGLKMF